MTHQLGASLPKPIAFVFSGGANLGAVQAGMLQALLEADILPDLVVGSSVGALNAAVVANHGMEQAVDMLTALWPTIRREDVFPGSVLAQAWQLARSRLYLFPNNRLTGLICRWLDVETFEELAIPLGVLTTELATQRGMLFNCGPIVPALLASTAIPGFFPTVPIDGVDYFDGGFTANVPMKSTLQMGAKSIVVLDVSSSCLPDQRPDHIADMMMTVIQSTLRSRVLVESPQVAAQVPVLYLPSPCTDHGQVFDFKHGKALIKEARDDCSHFLATCGLPSAGQMVGEVHWHPEELVCAMNGERKIR